MSQARWTKLSDRGVISIAGEDARPFLDNLVTSDVSDLGNGEARFAALLTPQGKILFEFFAVWDDRNRRFLLDVARDKISDLVKRFALYKLRAKVTIANESEQFAVGAAWHGARDLLKQYCLCYADPRRDQLGLRLIATADFVPQILAALGQEVSPDAYHARRIALGIPEGGKDYAFGDAFPHEVNMDRLNGVSFSKGCFVGQEVVARMQHKTVVRKHIVRVTGTVPLTTGAEIKVGEATIGTVGSVSANSGLAMLRLDRVIEALDKGQAITSGGHPLTVDAEPLDL